MKNRKHTNWFKVHFDHFCLHICSEISDILIPNRAVRNKLDRYGVGFFVSTLS